MKGIKIFKKRIKQIENKIERLEKEKQELGRQLKGCILYVNRKIYKDGKIWDKWEQCIGYSTIEDAKLELNTYRSIEEWCAKLPTPLYTLERKLTYIIYYNGEIVEENTETF